MTYFHATTEVMHEEYLKSGFISMKTMKRMEQDWRHVPQEYDPSADCRTIACDTPENAKLYGEGYYGNDREIFILAIEGDFDTSPLTGTMVPKNTVFLHGEISPAQISLYNPAPALTR
jgi:hypothetical protein